MRRTTVLQFVLFLASLLLLVFTVYGSTQPTSATPFDDTVAVDLSTIQDKYSPAPEDKAITKSRNASIPTPIPKPMSESVNDSHDKDYKNYISEAIFLLPHLTQYQQQLLKLLPAPEAYPVMATDDSPDTDYDNTATTTPESDPVMAANDSSDTDSDNTAPEPDTTPGPELAPGYTLVVAANDSPNQNEADFICDGFDDQNEIQAAIDELPPEGGTVMLLEGTYYIGDTILAERDTTIEGQGYNTLFYLMDNSNCNVISNRGGHNNWQTNVTIRNLRINGNKNNQSGGNGIIRSGEYAVYENLWVENCYNRGICHSWGNHTQITNNTIRNCDGRGIVLGETYEGIIANNELYNCGIIKDKEVCENRSIQVYHGGNIKITGNYIDGGGLSRQIGAWDSPYVEITGNTLWNGLTMGIAPHSQYARVTDNTITNCGENAIDLCGEKDCWVEGNTISVVSGVHEGTGICVNSERSTIINNYIELCGRTGIHLGPDYNNNLILDNTVKNCGQRGTGQAGIWVQIWNYGSLINRDVVIRGNRCFDDQDVPTQLYGVMLSASHGYIDNITIEDNDLRNNGTAAINSYIVDRVRNAVMRNNLGFSYP